MQQQIASLQHTIREQEETFKDILEGVDETQRKGWKGKAAAGLRGWFRKEKDISAQLETTTKDLHTVRAQLQETTTNLQSARAMLRGKTYDLQSARAQVQVTNAKLQDAMAELKETESKLQSVTAELQVTKTKLQHLQARTPAGTLNYCYCIGKFQIT